MALSLEELFTTMSRKQVLELAIAILKGHGFPADSWQSGSIERTEFEAFSELISEQTVVVQRLARAGFNSTATGLALDLLSKSHYDNKRLEGIETQGTIRLSDLGNTGPHTIDVGDVVVKDTVNGFRFRNTTGGTLSLGLYLDCTFEAELVGHEQNLADGADWVVVEGPPGVGATNPGPDWITTQGASVESDNGLRRRNVTKWATLSSMAPSAAYEYWARFVSAVVTRVYVDDQNPRGPNTLDLYLASAVGAVTEGAAPLVTGVVSDYILGVTDGRRRAGLGADLLVLSAVGRSVAVTGTVYYQATAKKSVVKAAVKAALTTYFEELPIGGTKSDDPEQGRLQLSSLYSQVLCVPGVVNVVFTWPTANINLAANEVVVATLSGITYEPAVF